MRSTLTAWLSVPLLIVTFASSALAELSRIEILRSETLQNSESPMSYQAVYGLLHFTLDPTADANQKIADINLAPVNAQGLVEFSTDFKLLTPAEGTGSSVLLYHVNNRGSSRLPPEISLNHPLSLQGHTYLATGWIAELPAATDRLRLHAPVVTDNGAPITGKVRYEIVVDRAVDTVNVAGSGHLGYLPSSASLEGASLTHRALQTDQRQSLPRDAFSIQVEAVDESPQPQINLNLKGGFQPGVIYELIYEATNPVLAGAGLAGIRDAVSAIRQQHPATAELPLPPITHAIAWGYSQSGRLLRQFLHQGFNEDLDGAQVFEGIVPLISGAGFGMFNQRFAMPTRTNGQHENGCYPNDFFPFGYGESTDPFSGRVDSILRTAITTNTEPKVMHIQTTNEYWLRGGSLVHTDPLGTTDADIPANVRLYTIGGSPHSPGSGVASAPTTGQLSSNPNFWTPIADSLVSAMVEWVRDQKEPPGSVYPRISDGSLQPSHLSDGRINPRVWRDIPGINTPHTAYQVAYIEAGHNVVTECADQYVALVPATGEDNNDLSNSTLLPPMTAAPLASFVAWNLRSEASGASTELARLTGGWLALPPTQQEADAAGDPRPALETLYKDAQQYRSRYEAAADKLIEQGYLLPGFKADLMRLMPELK